MQMKTVDLSSSAQWIVPLQEPARVARRRFLHGLGERLARMGEGSRGSKSQCRVAGREEAGETDMIDQEVAMETATRSVDLQGKLSDQRQTITRAFLYFLRFLSVSWFLFPGLFICFLSFWLFLCLFPRSALFFMSVLLYSGSTLASGQTMDVWVQSTAMFSWLVIVATLKAALITTTWFACVFIWWVNG